MLRNIVLMVSGALLSGMVWAGDSGVASGQITFTGSIVQAPCDLNTDSQALHSRCYNNGETYTTSVPLSVMSGKQVALSGMPADVSLKWINSEKTTGVMTVTYR